MSAEPKWLKGLDTAIAVIAVIAVVYHVVAVRMWVGGPLMHQNRHLAIILTLVFLSAARKKPKYWPIWLAFTILSLLSTGYVQVFYYDLEIRAGFPTLPDLVIGVLLIFLVLVSAWKAAGYIIPTIVTLFVAYCLTCTFIPGPLGGALVSFESFISMSSIGLSGMYGTYLGVSVNYIFLFLVFGAFLEATGATAVFTEFGKLLTRTTLRSGAAMTAIVPSALVGMTSGSAVANVAITGVFSIPLMKRCGYTPAQAGAFEASASSGGQIMPPVMATAAFLMADILGIPYLKVCALAAIPAILYYVSLFFNAELRARRLNMAPLPAHETVLSKANLVKSYLFLIPLAVLIWVMLSGYTPMFAAVGAILSSVALSMVRKETRLSLRQWVAACTKGAIAAAEVGVVVVCLSSMVVALTTTGLGIKLPTLLEKAAHGNVPLLLLFIIVSCFILGMGMPTVAAYLLVSMAMLPALIRLGMSPEASHLFVIYYAVFSAVTPPVAVAALPASKLAGADYVQTGIEAFKLSLSGFLVPIMFLFNDTLLGQFHGLLPTIVTLAIVLLAILCQNITVTGFYISVLALWERALSALSCVAFMAYVIGGNALLLVTGLCLFAILTAYQLMKARKKAAQAMKF